MAIQPRCNQCQSTFKLNLDSSHPCNYVLQTHFCPDCHKVLLAALSTIPAKFKHLSIPTDEVTLEQLKRWEKAHLDELRAQGNYPFFDKSVVTVDDDNIMRHKGEVLGRGAFEGRRFGYLYQTVFNVSGEPSEILLVEHVEHNIETGERKPWL